jgi:hypothetical protein
MERLKRGIYATAMNARIMKAYEEIDNEDIAECMLNDWLANGVPDGNTLVDNIEDFGNQEDYNELVDTFFEICEDYDIEHKVFYEEVEEIKKNIVEMLDNPYYNMV